MKYTNKQVKSATKLMVEALYGVKTINEAMSKNVNTDELTLLNGIQIFQMKEKRECKLEKLSFIILKKQKKTTNSY